MNKCLGGEDIDFYVGVNYCGCLLVADDILLISASVLKLHCMLTFCYGYCKALDNKINVSKYNLLIVERGDKNNAFHAIRSGNIKLGCRNEISW